MEKKLRIIAKHKKEEYNYYYLFQIGLIPIKFFSFATHN